MVTSEIKTSTSNGSSNSLSSIHMNTRKEAVKMQLEPNDVLNESGTLLDHWMDQDSAASLSRSEANGTHNDNNNDAQLRPSNASVTHEPTIAEDSADLFQLFRWSKALPDAEFEYRRHVFGYHHQTHMCRNRSPLKMEDWFQDFDFDGKELNPFVLLRTAIRVGKMSSSGKRQTAIAKTTSPITLRPTTTISPKASLRASKSLGVSPGARSPTQRRSLFGVTIAEKAVSM